MMAPRTIPEGASLHDALIHPPIAQPGDTIYPSVAGTASTVGAASERPDLTNEQGDVTASGSPYVAPVK